jgi:hypothetical protein
MRCGIRVHVGIRDLLDPPDRRRHTARRALFLARCRPSRRRWRLATRAIWLAVRCRAWDSSRAGIRDSRPQPSTRAITQAVLIYLAGNAILLPIDSAGGITGLFVVLATIVIANAAQISWLGYRSRAALRDRSGVA